PTRPAATKYRASGKKYQLTAIGTSTGGPVALQKILTRLPMNYPHPIVLIQHMPATFTAAFASRLNTLCKIQVKEAQDGDVLQPGVAYLAPGGKQMMVDGRAGAARLRIIDGGDRMNYKPCVDVTFGSAAKVYGDKVLSLVLTGMGADGREGARMLKSAGSTIWAQDEESCVVYGMPQAVAKAGISSEDLPLDRIAERMLVEVGLA
ncbi:chemotaxis-specific protein-glutamate methyltransferase CheB, partial [Vibrio parahaemolyticus]|nr:chemotaxis-specific protein-glutamate methyltransferase CheB [Vibrio parahaemolyticus]